MDDEKHPEDKSDDGTRQDVEIALRSHVNQIKELVQELVKARFGKEITPDEAIALDDVHWPFHYASPKEMEEGMTQEEYDDARTAYFARIKELRPTLLRLFDLDEETANYEVCDLGDPSTEEIDRLDAFLVTAFRFSLRM
jgi:hypothetical protein